MSKLHQLRGAHLVGADSVPLRGEFSSTPAEIRVSPRGSEPAGLSLLWPVPEVGTFQLETTRLPVRNQPYLLPLELARHRLMRINMKREEWGLFDYPGMDAFAATVEKARKQFIHALQQSDDPAAAGPAAENALTLALEASDLMSRFHAGVFLNRRHQTGGFSRPFLGCTAPPMPPANPLVNALKDHFDFLRLPIVWRDIQPKERPPEYTQLDQWVDVAQRNKLPLVAGPLLNFGVAFVPDWMYIWENDFETIFEYCQEHIRKTAKRFAGKVDTWIVASGLHADNALAFSFEQVMELTRMAVAVTREAAPRTKILIDLVQPWGEYYARNQQAMPPYYYAEMLVQGGIPFDGFGVQLMFGLNDDGYHLRDELQISALIDRLANFGKPLHVTALAAPSQDGESSGGVGAKPWSPETQAAWLRNCCELALSKPYVESVCLRELVDGHTHTVPSAGVLTAAYRPKLALETLSALRDRLRKPPAK